MTGTDTYGHGAARRALSESTQILPVPICDSAAVPRRRFRMSYLVTVRGRILILDLSYTMG